MGWTYFVVVFCCQGYEGEQAQYCQGREEEHCRGGSGLGFSVSTLMVA